MNDPEILAKFVSRFEPDSEDVRGQVNVISAKTDKTELENLYSILPAKFPSLYEHLVLSFRWKRSIVGDLLLLANPAGPNLTGLRDEIFADKHLCQACLKNGFIQFAFSASSRYDPVCFDTNKKRIGGNHGIVSLKHEELLCNARIKVQSILAPSFEELVTNLQ